MKPIYFDYAATTPVDPRVVDAMLPFLKDICGNPSSVHSFGRAAKSAVRDAREEIAKLIDAEAEHIFFTSGGSESDALLLKGYFLAQQDAGKRAKFVTSTIEHHAVLRTCETLQSRGAEIVYVGADKEGSVSPAAVTANLDEGAALVSVMTANNEIGTIEPIQEIAAAAHARGALFHTDAVQAVGHIPLSVRDMGIDALSLSGHKLYAPKGIGALYVHPKVKILPLIEGGEQERGMRAGTENVPAIIGLGCAAKLANEEMAAEGKRMRALGEKLAHGIQLLQGAYINGKDPASESRLPGNVNFGIAGIASDTMLIRLDLAGFAVSAGSACSSGSIAPSHVLMAIGCTKARAGESIRVSLGRFTKEKDIDVFLSVLREIVQDRAVK